MGGGSSVMGLWALRGVPSDFDAWAAAGAQGWGWSDVVRFYRRLEGDQDRDHSQMRPGPYKIRRTPVEEWPGFVTAIERAAAARGVRTVGDINENPVDGFFAIPLAQDDDGRASSARCYLTSEVRRRPNLSVMSQTRVTGLRFDGAKVVGCHGRARRRESGAVGARGHSLRRCNPFPHDAAALGHRAGRGTSAPRHHAARRPARRRAQSPEPSLSAFCADAAAALAAAGRPAPFRHRGDPALIRTRRLPARRPARLHDGARQSASFGADVAMVGAALYSPYSRGAVTLASADINVPPRVAFNMFDDPRDAPRMLQGGALCASAAVRSGRRRHLQGRVPAAAGDGAEPVQPAGPRRARSSRPPPRPC